MKLLTNIFLTTSVVLTFIFSSCGSSKKAIAAKINTAQDSLPALPASEVNIPVKVFLPRILAKIETMVPKEFTSDKWPDYTQSGCDFRYKYRFLRSPLKIAFNGNQVNIGFSGNYQIAGSRTICAFGTPVAPWVTGTCGYGNEPMRRVNIVMIANINYLPQYKLRTNTSVAQLLPVDKCQVTIFNSDMTNQVMDSIKATIASFTRTLDSSVAAVDFSKILKLVSTAISRKIQLSKYGFLQVRPTSVRISPTNVVNDTLVLTVGVSGYAELTSDSTSLPTVSVLPDLQAAPVDPHVIIYANTHYEYGFLSKIISDTIRDKVFDIEGRTFVIKNVELRGTEKKQLQIDIDFTGNKIGRFTLFGTPVLDIEKQFISIPDINYDITTKDILLNVGEKLFRSRIINSLRQKAVVDIPALIRKNQLQLDAQLSRSFNKNLTGDGHLEEIRITGLVVAKDTLHLQLQIVANLALIASGF